MYIFESLKVGEPVQQEIYQLLKLRDQQQSLSAKVLEAKLSFEAATVSGCRAAQVVRPSTFCLVNA
jgi:hypothetical protein